MSFERFQNTNRLETTDNMGKVLRRIENPEGIKGLFTKKLMHKLILYSIFLGMALNPFPVLAQAGNAIISKDGTLTLRSLTNLCTLNDPVSEYSVKRGVRGILYVTACKGDRFPNVLTERVRYRFIDVGGDGAERCYGILDASTINTLTEQVWKVRGAVPSYPCNTVGRSYTLLLPKSN